MSAKADQLLREVLQLPEPERWGLLARLLDVLDTVPDADEDEGAWARELERRADDAEAGRTVDIPAEDALADLRRKYEPR